MKKRPYLDVVSNTPKENAAFIEGMLKRDLLFDKNLIFWVVFVFQTSKYGFFQFLPDSIYSSLLLVSVLWGVYMLFLLFLAELNFDRVDDSFVDEKQKADLFRLATINKNVGRYLFLLRVSGRSAYVAEYKQLMRHGLSTT